MFEELKKLCEKTLASNIGENDIISFGDAYSTKKEVRELLQFLKKIEQISEEKERKKFIIENYANIPYIMEFDKTSDLGKFQRWIEEMVNNG